jgi:hypothetical protein
VARKSGKGEEEEISRTLRPIPGSTLGVDLFDLIGPDIKRKVARSTGGRAEAKNDTLAI